jgi:hypothetical protein
LKKFNLQTSKGPRHEYNFLIWEIGIFWTLDLITLIAPCNLPLLKGEELIGPLS